MQMLLNGTWSERISSMGERTLIPFILMIAGLISSVDALGFTPYTMNVTEHRITKAALSGQPQRIEYLYSLDPVCNSRGTVTVRVVTPPDSGNITISPGEDYPSFATSNTRSQCNTKKAPVTNIVYQSEPGFVGTDTATVEAIFPDGGYRKIEFTIYVR